MLSLSEPLLLHRCAYFSTFYPARGSYFIKMKVLQRCNAKSAAQYISSVAGNATAIQAIAATPQTLSTGVWGTTENLRPYK